MDLSKHRKKTKKTIVETQVKPSMFKRFCHGICPCVSIENQSMLATQASFLTHERQDHTELSQMNPITPKPTSFPTQQIPYEVMTPPKFKSTFEKTRSPKKTHDLIPQRSSSEIRSSNHPVMQFREMELMTIGDSKIKMLAKITSNRFVPSKEAIHKTQLLSSKKQISLFANPDFDEFSRSRYLFFEKYDQGIQLDKESWYNAIPEAVAEYIAMKAKCTTILDGLCGIGSMAIKFANTCHTVIANEPNEDKLYYFDNNTAIYGADNIIKSNKEFIEINGANPDVIFLHPKIKKAQDNDLPFIHPSTYFNPPIQQLLTKSFSMTNNVIMILPGNVDIEQLGIIYHNCLKQSQGCDTVSCSIQIEKVFFNKKLRYVIVYYGPLVNRSITMKEELSFIYKILNEGAPTSFRYKNVVKHIRSRYGMVELLELTSQCLKYEKQTMMDRFFEMIRVKELLSQKLLTNLMKPSEMILNKKSTFEEEKFDEQNYGKDQEQYSRNSSDRTTSFITDEGDNVLFIKDQMYRQTIIVNPNRKSQPFSVSSYCERSDISMESLERTKLHQDM